MPVIGFTELHQHAIEQQYSLAVINAPALPIAKGIIQSGLELDAPLVLSVCGSDLAEGLLPSLEAMARQAQGPMGLLAKRIENTEQAIAAIRLGCSGLVLVHGLSDAVSDEIRAMATSCGISVLEQEALSGSLYEIHQVLETKTLDAIAQASSWQEVDKLATQAAAAYMRDCLEKLGATGQGQAVLKTCKPWRPVEHLIIYNTNTDDVASEELAAEGRRVLDRIPGVRATWSGRAVKADAGYQWCWLIRFAHPAVIDSYREHPDHVAYADNFFRPAAGDRISIDYELIGVEET
jgi:hypothetical protein